jgi:hypothetical protein
MPKEDFTEREIRKIKELIMYLLNKRLENKLIEMREKLNEVAAENEFPDFNALIKTELKDFDTLLNSGKQNAVVSELYFQLMELEAQLTNDELKRVEYYKKALLLGMHSEKLDRTFSLSRNEMLERIMKEIG